MGQTTDRHIAVSDPDKGVVTLIGLVEPYAIKIKMKSRDQNVNLY